MEDSIGCKIGNFQTESNVIMIHKYSTNNFRLQTTNHNLQ